MNLIEVLYAFLDASSYSSSTCSSNGTNWTDYSFVDRLLKLELIAQSLDVAEALTEKIPLGPSLRHSLAQASLHVSPHLLTQMEPYHAVIDGYGNRMVDSAEHLATHSVKFVQRVQQDVVRPITETMDSTKKAVTKSLDQLVVEPVRFAAVQVDHKLVTPVSQTVLKTADTAVSQAANVVDWLLPPPTAANVAAVSAASNEGEEEEDSQIEQLLMDANGDPLPASAMKSLEENGTQPLRRALRLTETTAQRLLALFQHRSQSALKQTEELLHVRSTLDLLQQYHQHLEASSLRLRETVRLAEQFLLENMKSAEKRQATASEVSEFVQTKRDQLAKPTLEAVMGIQARLIETMTEVKVTVSRTLHAVQGQWPVLPERVQNATSQVVNAVSSQWEHVMRSAGPLTEGLQSTNTMLTVENLLSHISALTKRASALLHVSTESLSVVDKVKATLTAYSPSWTADVSQTTVTAK